MSTKRRDSAAASRGPAVSKRPKLDTTKTPARKKDAANTTAKKDLVEKAVAVEKARTKTKSTTTAPNPNDRKFCLV